jgi:hypothetical protein
MKIKSKLFGRSENRRFIADIEPPKKGGQIAFFGIAKTLSMNYSGKLRISF